MKLAIKFTYYPSDIQVYFKSISLLSQSNVVNIYGSLGKIKDYRFIFGILESVTTLPDQFQLTLI